MVALRLSLPLPLRQTALSVAALCCLGAPVLGMAEPAAKIVGLSGDIEIVSAKGKAREPKSGGSIERGETVITGTKGQVDMQFSDGALVYLRPDSKFRIDDYAFKSASDTKAKGFFSLLAGQMRTVTGCIGKLDKRAYRVITPTATIGIRGTEYSARLSKGLYLDVARGEISVTNKAGSFAVAEGQRVYIANRKSAPQYLTSGGDGQRAGSTAASGSDGTSIQGNTRIDAETSNTQATAIGKGNTAKNQAGVIGGK